MIKNQMSVDPSNLPHRRGGYPLPPVQLYSGLARRLVYGRVDPIHLLPENDVWTVSVRLADLVLVVVAVAVETREHPRRQT